MGKRLLVLTVVCLAIPFFSDTARGEEPGEKKVWMDFYKFCLDAEQRGAGFSVVECRERAAKENGYEGWSDFVEKAKKALPAEAWVRIQGEANGWYKEQPGAGRGRGHGMAGMKEPDVRVVRPDPRGGGRRARLEEWRDTVRAELIVRPRDLTEEEKKEFQDVDLSSQVANVLQARLQGLGLDNADIQVAGEGGLLVSLPPLEEEDLEGVKALILRRGLFRFRLVADDALAKQHSGKEAPPGTAWFEYASKEKGGDKVLIMLDDGWNLGGDIIEKATIDKDHVGFPAVGFSIKKAFQDRFHDYTSKNSKEAMPPGEEGRRIAIIMDDRILSAPVIRAGIRDRGIITAGPQGFSVPEQKYLVVTLNSGAYPVDVVLVQERRK